MTTRAETSDTQPVTDTLGDVDVVVIGAGIAGIGAASRLASDLPHKSFLVVEQRESVGGTWDLFRYPGIRSDSDLFTYGYEYKPWTKEKTIAPGEDILSYLEEAVDEYGLTPHLRLGRKVVHAAWSTTDARWTLTLLNAATGREETVTAGWIFAATGYYDYDEGHRPVFDGEAEFGGQIVHPQHWPENFDYSGKRVVVIGSGATAVTLVPNMADDAAHVTMLQRSPTYIVAMPSRDRVFNALRKVLPAATAYRAARGVYIWRLPLIVGLSKRFPTAMRRAIRWSNKAKLPEGFDVDTHFNPSYDPWDQRMCIVPDGDFFAAISAGRASVVTDRIDRFDRDGIVLESGQSLPADVIVTATGLNMVPFGKVTASVDGREVDWSDTVTFKSMMCSGVPNFAFALGYSLNNSWTLKVDITTKHWCRVMDHMDRNGHAVVVPTLDRPIGERRPFIDNITSGYVTRGVGAFPHAGDSGPWVGLVKYRDDAPLLRNGPVDDDALVFSGSANPVAAEPEPAVRAV